LFLLTLTCCDRPFLGVFGKELATQLSKEVKTSRLETGECKVGMKVLFDEADSRYGNDDAFLRPRMRRQKQTEHTVKVGVNLGIVSFEYTYKSTKKDNNSSSSGSGSSSSSGGGGWWGKRSLRKQ